MGLGFSFFAGLAGGFAAGLGGLVISNRWWNHRRGLGLRPARPGTVLLAPGLEGALDGTREGVWSWNVSTGEARFNRRTVEMLGYELGEVAPSIRTWKRWVHPGDRAVVTEALELHLQGKIPVFEMEYRVVAKTGEIKWVLIRGKVVERDIAGRPLRMAGTVSDISQRKRVEQGLRTSERRMMDIINFLPDPTFVIDADRRVIAWNLAMAHLTGVFSPDIVGKGDLIYGEAFYGVRRPMAVDLILRPELEHQAEYKQLKHLGEQLIAEVTTARFGGQARHFWVVASALRDIEGKVIGAIESIRDITDRKRDEERIRKSAAQARRLVNIANDANQAKGMFLANVSH
jgi:PAS domain S-box-containing protein